MNGMDSAALDRHITGNYGEDQFRDAVDDSCDHAKVEADDDGLGWKGFRCVNCGTEMAPEPNEDGGTDWVAL